MNSNIDYESMKDRLPPPTKVQINKPKKPRKKRTKKEANKIKDQKHELSVEKVQNHRFTTEDWTKIKQLISPKENFGDDKQKFETAQKYIIDLLHINANSEQDLC